MCLGDQLMRLVYLENETLQVFTNTGNETPNYEELGDQAIMKQLVLSYDNYAIRNHVKVGMP